MKMRAAALIAGILALLLVPIVVAAVAHGVHPGARSESGSACSAGEWRVFDAGVRSGGGLNAVATRSPSDVWAVGAYDASATSNFEATLIEHWDGARWRVVTSPSPGNVGNVLDGVVAVSLNDVWAVGSWQSAPVYGGGIKGPQSSSPLIEHWDGGQWRITPLSPAAQAAGARYGALSAIVATSAHDVWAVGATITERGKATPLIMRWDGATWQVVHGVRFTYTGQAQFTAVAASGPHDVWVAGSSIPPGGGTSGGMTLLEHWDGVRWSQTPFPAAALTSAFVRLAAVSPRSAWIVGMSLSGAPNAPGGVQSLPLFAHWDGARWSAVPAPAQAVDEAPFSIAVAPQTQRIWIGGAFSNSFAAYWNGTGWTPAAPAPARVLPTRVTPSFDSPYSLTGDAAGALWLVGTVREGQGHQAVTNPAIARYQAACAG